MNEDIAPYECLKCGNKVLIRTINEKELKLELVED